MDERVSVQPGEVTNMLVNRSPLSRPLSSEGLEANRHNARKSKGPVSARGRAVSSQNGRKFDLLPFEKPTIPAQLTAQYYGRFTPQNRNERRLVDILVHSERVRRYCLSVEARARAAGTTAVPRYRDAAACAHDTALRQLEAIRLTAA